MNKIKILHISFAGGGGVDIAIRIINENINPSKFEIIIIREKEHELYVDKNGVNIASFVVPVKREISFSDFYYGIKLFRLIKRLKPDIIHLHSAKAGVLGRLIGMAITRNIFYTPHAFSYLSAENLIKRKIYLGIEKLIRILSPKSIIVACSMSEYNRAIQEVGYSKKNVQVYNNSIPKIDNNNLTMPEDISLPPDYLCTIGRPSYQKNLETMIEVLNGLHKINQPQYLVIMGIGFYSPEFEKIKNKTKEYGLERFITFLPWVKRDQALGILKNSSIYLSTARYEGLPISVIEAMSFGIPVVATQVDGNKDLVINNKTGFLIKEMNINEFVEKIKLILANKTLRKRFSSESIKQFIENYNSEKNINILEKIYVGNFEHNL